MLTDGQVRQLAKFDGHGAPVLSLYLDLDPARQVRHSYRIALEDLVNGARESLDKRTREALTNEVSRLEEWLDGHEPAGRGLVAFSCATQGLQETHELPVHVEDHLSFEPRPDVGPLLELIDENERYAVALVDKQRARLFTVFLGEIEESDEIFDYVPPKTDQGGLSQSHFQRHHELHVLWHLKHVAQHLTELFRRRSFDRLIIAGHEEAMSELKTLLPRALARRVAAEIPADTQASEHDILEKSLEVERGIEQEGEEHLLDYLLEVAGSGGRAIVGRQSTLEALYLDEVRTLVASAGLAIPGSDCPNCRWLEPGTPPNAACSKCGTAVRPVHDLVHAVMTRAVELGGTVESVHGDAARRLEERGGLGALLRFR